MADALERRVAEGLRTVDLGEPLAPPTRDALLGALRRYRSRRRRAGVLAAAAAVAVGGVGWAALAGGRSGGPSPGRVAAPSALSGHLPPARSGCAQVLHAGATAGGSCVGSYASPALSSPANTPYSQDTYGATGSPAAPSPARALRVRVGRSVAVELPAAPAGSAWGVPTVTTGAAGGALSLAHAGGGGRPVTVTVTGRRVGVATVVASAACAPARCSGAQWSVRVEVSP